MFTGTPVSHYSLYLKLGYSREPNEAKHEVKAVEAEYGSGPIFYIICSRQA